MKLTADKLFSEIFILMTHCATADLEYLASNECANRFKNVLEGIKQYKDIEKELGIDLTILIKIIKDGVFVKTSCRNKGTIFDLRNTYTPIDYDEKGFYVDCDEWGVNIMELFYFKDYGKTWAFTKEELDK